MKNLIYSVFFLLALGITSCSSDDDKGTNVTSSYTYDGQRYDVRWASYYLKEGHGVQIALATSTPENPSYLYQENEYFIIDVPIEYLGETHNLNSALYGSSWSFYCAYVNNGTYYTIDDEQSEGDNDDVTGSNNVFKVVKNNGEHNYTIEFEFTVNGKLLKGNYSGVLIKQERYMDVYL